MSRSGDGNSFSRSVNRDNSTRDASNRSSARDNGPRQQQSYFRGPTNTDRDYRTADRSDRVNRNNDNRSSNDWRNQVFDNNNRERGNDRENRNNFLRNTDDRNRDRDNWSRTSTRIRNDWNRYDRNSLPFRYGWWDNYRGNNWPVFLPFGYSRWSSQPYYWWGWTPAGRLTSYFAFGWNRPRYWDYGYGGNIWYGDGYVYYDGDRYLPVNDYYQQVYDLAHSVPTISQQDAETMDWAPLGVFVASRSSQDGEAGQRTLQLAVNKEGLISGTYFNSQNKQVHPLIGMVDERNQRAAFAFADGEQPKLVFETSIFNLTKDESTMMVHYGPSERDTEVWHLVRLEQPTNSSNAGAQQTPNASVNALP